ncbi:hypothetical protein AAFF_G00250000 [Aldrovandia affinis]|uniref:UPAR/Ly6 domain-containing protein n=1 Tax=Aldrovandia affinis TaxID=143900 RepID=A0AAD7RCY1_9TELE|nr:hypothetical protein AAFF_G00250000 [Aldrovandia affinis]
MTKLLFGIFAVAASLVIVESLICNRCRAGLLGKCLVSGTINCSAVQNNCFTGKAAFKSIPDFIGFYTQGCLDSFSCNKSTTGTILGASYNSTLRCCSTNRCTPSGGASTVQLSLTAAAALLVSLWSGVRC